MSAGATYPPRCQECRGEMRALFGSGRGAWFCPSDCDREPKRPRCPECGTTVIEPFAIPWSTVPTMHCIPNGHVWAA